MSIRQPSRIHALGTFIGPIGQAAVARGFADTFTVNGPGDYTLTMDQAVDLATCTVAAFSTSLGFFIQGVVDPTQPAEDQIRIRFDDLAGQGQDVNFTVRICNFISATG